MSRKILNFKKDQEYRINSVNIIDGMLFFTDNNSEPKRIELDTFRKADHSSGTTVVFGREFKERDITVIRPQPLDTLNIDIFNPVKNDDYPDGDGTPDGTATEPTVNTGRSVVRINEADLHATVNANGATIVVKGFYYIKQDQQPTLSEIRNNGTNVTTTTSAEFKTTISVDDGYRYWYIAYAYNGFNEIVIAPNIETFYVTKATVTDPTIDTSTPVEVSNGMFRLEGTVTDPGDSAVASSGFFVEYFEQFNSPTKPANLHSRSSTVNAPTQRVVTGATDKYYVDNLANSGKNFWVQFYIVRASDSKVFYGDVEEFKDIYTPNHPRIKVVKADVVQMDAPVLGQIPQTLDLRVVSQIENIDPNATLDEAGVYFYSGNYDANFQNIRNRYDNNTAGNRGVVKIKWDGLSTSTWRDEFAIQAANATLEAEYDIEYGKTNYFYSYLKQTLPNGNVLWAYKAGFAKLEKPEPYGPPLVITHDFYNINETSLACWAKSTGGSGDLEAMGFYIYQENGEDFGVSDLTSPSAQSRMVQLYAEGKATKFVFKSNGSNLISEGLPVTPVPSFTGSQNVNITRGGTYFGMAFGATSDGFEGQGSVLRHRIAAPADIGLSMLSVQEVGNSGLGDYTGSGQIFRFKIIGPRNEDWDDLTQVGFQFAETAERDFEFDASGNTTVKYNTSGITVKSGKTVTKHQNYLQLDSSSVTADGTIELFAPNATYFSGGYGETWSVQGFIEFTDGTIIKTTYDNGTQTDGRPGVMEFRPINPNPHNYAVPSVQAGLETVKSGSISNAKYDNLFFLIRVPKVSYNNTAGDVLEAKKLYIIKESFLTDKTDPIEIVDKVDDDGLGFSYPGYGVSFPVHEGNPGLYQDFVNDIAIQLEPNTAYRFVGAAKNNSTNYDSRSGASSLTNGAGWGYSNSMYFKTMPKKQEVWWDNDNNPGRTTIDPASNEVTFACYFQDGNPPNRQALNLYIVKASAIGSNPTHAQIVADSDTVSYNMLATNSDNTGAYVPNNTSTNPVFWKINGLDRDTEYWVTLKATISGIANTGGHVIHKPFKITTAPKPVLKKELYIINGDSTKGQVLEFDGSGRRYENGLQEQLAEAYTGTSPEDGYYIRLGKSPANMELRGYYSGSNVSNPNSEFYFRFLKDRDLGDMIQIKHTPTPDNSQVAKAVYLKVLPMDATTPVIEFVLHADEAASFVGNTGGGAFDVDIPTGPFTGSSNNNVNGTSFTSSNTAGTGTVRSTGGSGGPPPNLPTDDDYAPAYLSVDPGREPIY